MGVICLLRFDINILSVYHTYYIYIYIVMWRKMPTVINVMARDNTICIFIYIYINYCCSVSRVILAYTVALNERAWSYLICHCAFWRASRRLTLSIHYGAVMYIVESWNVCLHARQLGRRVLGILPFLCRRNKENSKFCQKVVVLAKFRPQAAARLQKQPVQRDDGCLFWHYFRWLHWYQ